jgi:OOP family OmpA-OmpF porin
MNDNLLALIQQFLGGDFSGNISEFLGESQGSTQSALGLLLPVVLGGIAQKGATPQGASSLLSLLNGADLDVGAIGDPAGLFGGGGAGANAMMKSGGGDLVTALFGDKGGALSNALASSSGVKGGSATNLLAVVVPLILAFLKKFIGAKGLNASSLSSLLAAQGPHLKNSLDSRLTTALGFPDANALLGSLGSHVSGKAAGALAGSSAVVAKATDKSGQARWLPWVIAAALLFMLWNLFYGKPTEIPQPDIAETTAPVFEPEPAALSAALPARIYFDVGAAAVSADGYSTIAAVAGMINRDGLNVAVTGYTDQSGDLAMNEKLAKDRVLAVVDALKSEGVPDSAIRMQPPMFVEVGASEGTDAEARRVDIDVQ